MPSSRDTAASRRRFVQFLAGSPLLAAGAGSAQVGAPTVKHLVPAMVRRVA